jgi:transposase
LGTGLGCVVAYELRCRIPRPGTAGAANIWARLSPARAITRARILLKADRGPGGPHWTDTAIMAALDVSRPTVRKVRQEFARDGVAAIERRRPRMTRPHKLDGAQEAHLIALTCSDAPAGHARWTLRLLADRFALIDGGEVISHEQVRRVLKKANSSRG